jgi:putative PIN family toxin of toxin-antitoxin system
MRAVLDTNVLLSALRGGRTRAILIALAAGRFQLLSSPPLTRELRLVLARPEWRKALDAADCRELLSIITEASHIVHPTQRITACRDPEDNALLECALAGHADYLVTGDRDLLVLDPFRGIRILRPAEFLTRLG